MNRMGYKSRRELQGVHVDLVVVVTHAMLMADDVDFMVFDGLRTEPEQRENIARGVSWTMNSKHLRQDDGFGHAVDLVPYVKGKITWESPSAFKRIEKAMKDAAEHHAISVEWGYDLWKKDMPHWQLGT